MDWTAYLRANTYETGRVVVTHGLCVTEGFQDGIGLHDLLLQTLLLNGRFVLFGRRTNGGEVRNDLLGVLSLSGTRLSSNQHRLVLMVGQHLDVRVVRDGENMGRHLITALATVHLRATVGVHRVALVRIDGNAEKARVRLDVCGWTKLINIRHIFE